MTKANSPDKISSLLRYLTNKKNFVQNPSIKMSWKPRIKSQPHIHNSCKTRISILGYGYVLNATFNNISAI